MPWIDPTKSESAPVEITADMLDLYEQMRVIKCSCTPADVENLEECSGCVRWFDLNHQLLRLLGKSMPVHEFAVTTPPSGNAVEPERATERMAAFEQALPQREDKT